MPPADTQVSQEPLNPDERDRQAELPVGLKNLGNTCYFNSFIQSFFFMPHMQRKILEARVNQTFQPPHEEKDEKAMKEFKRKEASAQMISNLRILFG